tara:strand:- start:12009 stop:12212 length:204 start_codon:yes stop_codon:yes gene_type:complete
VPCLAPFYTTKARDKGTGLGLSVSWRIISQHGGRIEVESTLAQGTTFRAYLPINYAETAEPKIESVA